MATLIYLTPRILIAFWLTGIVFANKRTWTNCYWAACRSYRLLGWRLIGRLIVHFKWHNVVLDTNIPNIKFLRVSSITLVNGYGQTHKHDYERTPIP